MKTNQIQPCFNARKFKRFLCCAAEDLTSDLKAVKNRSTSGTYSIQPYPHKVVLLQLLQQLFLRFYQ